MTYKIVEKDFHNSKEINGSIECYIQDSEGKYMYIVIDGGDPLGMNLLAVKKCCVKYGRKPILFKKTTPAYKHLKKVVKDLNKNDGVTKLENCYFFAFIDKPNQEAFEKACEEYKNKYGVRKSIFDKDDN